MFWHCRTFTMNQYIRKIFEHKPRKNSSKSNKKHTPKRRKEAYLDSIVEKSTINLPVHHPIYLSCKRYVGINSKRIDFNPTREGRSTRKIGSLYLSQYCWPIKTFWWPITSSTGASHFWRMSNGKMKPWEASSYCKKYCRYSYSESIKMKTCVYDIFKFICINLLHSFIFIDWRRTKRILVVQISTSNVKKQALH